MRLRNILLSTLLATSLTGNTIKPEGRNLRYITDITPTFDICEDYCPTHPRYVWFTTTGPKGKETYRLDGRHAKEWHEEHGEGTQQLNTYQLFYKENKKETH